MKYKILSTILLIAIANTALADGVNKKKVRRKPKPHITKPEIEIKPTPKPKLPPSLLETKMELAMTPEIKPTLPLLNIPIVPPQQIMEIETRTFEFEEKKDRKALLFLIGGAIAGTTLAIILNKDENPIPVSSPTPQIPQSVPESSSLFLGLIGVGLIGFYLRREK